MKQKYLLLLGDGMGDYPIAEMGNQTPLEIARTPAMDYLAQRGQVGLARTIPPGMPKGSDVANLSILGYDPARYYTGRAPLEAASMGLTLAADEVAYRCNLVNIRTPSEEALLTEGEMVDYSAGHVTSAEAEVLIRLIDEKLGNQAWRFYPGVSYRHLMVARGGPEKVDCTPPHDIPGKPLSANLPQGEGAGSLISLMQASYAILSAHPINLERERAGKLPANLIWLWGQGKTPSLVSFREKYDLWGSIISAVDLVKGLGRIAGLEVIEVPGATGYLDTNFEGKAQALIESIGKLDFCYLHLEAPDEAAHNGDLRAKIRAIEMFDQRIIGPVIEGLKGRKGVKVLLLCDHLTPIAVRTHTDDPVPFLISSLDAEPKAGLRYTESDAHSSGLFFPEGHRLLEHFLRRE
jgi:2,3-bisphosphoglycerate-independent phosphoglycerate mutase